MPATTSSIGDKTGTAAVNSAVVADAMSSFRLKMMESLREGVVFLNSHGQILLWNSSMEIMTGVSKNIVGQRLTPGLLKLRDEGHEPVPDSQNPFEKWLLEKSPASATFEITGISGRHCDVSVEFHPVQSADGKNQGGVVLFLDTSLQNDLQRQLNALQTIATIDPLTQVGNRAEFERLLEEYVRTHKQVGLKCSLVIGDLDYFKKINDTWGHHIGDHALVAFAQLLKHHVRGRDFVARYGGEEFVILCANCDEEAAAKRAEVIRKELSEIAQPMMQGQKMTASFGVTELRADDDPTSLFVRADKALLWAKQTGRNRVVISGQEPAKNQEGTAEADRTGSPSGAEWPAYSRTPSYSCELSAPDLLPLFIEKLKAWVEETKCRLEFIREDRLRVSLTQTMPDNPKVSGLIEVELDLVQKQLINNPRNLPEGTRVVMRVSTFGRPTLWKKVDFQKLGEHAVNHLRQIVGLQDDKFLVKWPVRKKEETRRYK